MLTPRTSPPPTLGRPGRSIGKRRSIQNMGTPPVPLWDMAGVSTPPVPARDKRDKHLYTPQPSFDSPADNFGSPRPSPRPLYDVTSPRPRNSPRPALMTPPVIAPVSPSISRRPKLLPAIPLEIDPPSYSTPRSRRSVQVNGYPQDKSVQIVINSGRQSPEVPPSPALREKRSSTSLRRACVTPTPPRPARRRRDSAVSPRQVELFPPQADFSRASSPFDDSGSVSTISDAPTPRATPRAVPEEVKGSKRDSTQRRLDALRGLVANLDFNQPWSMTDDGAADNRDNRAFWASPDVQETLCSPAPAPAPNPRSLYASPSQSSLHISRPFPIADQIPLQDHGWEAKPSPRPRSSRSESNLHTPTRVRKELFNVASSGYTKSLAGEPASTIAPPTPETTWRSSLSSDALFYRVLETRGADEIKRQEVMWEMCETEQAFLKSMRNVLRLFATPLKTPQGRWIDGIPERISQLFDSLESVAHAHSVIAAVQRDMRRKSEVVDINAFVRALKSWVPKLEVYESYLLRFEPVVALVEDHIRDPGSVFGEFVRMQLKEEILGSMSLGSMLLKPVQRLMKYPLFLKRLLDVTPCHPELLSLLASTESIILTLQAAKAKEEDFDQLVSLESRLSGLPPDFGLVQRGRKLTGYGSVLRVYPNSFASMMTSSRSSVSSSISSASSPWDTAYSASTCRSSSFSVSSVTSSVPSRSGSLRMSPSAFSTSPKRPGVYRSPSSASSTAGTDSSRPNTPSMGRRRSKDELALFIFDDLVILAAPSEKAGIFSSKSKKEKGWRVLGEHEGGVGKLVEVKDWSGFGGLSALFVLTILPLASHLREPLLPVTICLTIPPPASPSASTPSRTRTPALNCPHLTTLPHFLNALAQATTAGPGDASVYMEEKEREEVLYYHHNDNHQDGDRVEIAFGTDEGEEHPLHSLRALGYAQ